MKGKIGFGMVLVLVLAYSQLMACGGSGGGGGGDNKDSGVADMTAYITPAPLISSEHCGLTCAYWSPHDLVVKNNSQEDISITSITVQVIQNSIVVSTWDITPCGGFICLWPGNCTTPYPSCVSQLIPAAGGQQSYPALYTAGDVAHMDMVYLQATLKYIINATKSGSPIQAVAAAGLNP